MKNAALAREFIEVEPGVWLRSDTVVSVQEEGFGCVIHASNGRSYDYDGSMVSFFELLGHASDVVLVNLVQS